MNPAAGRTLDDRIRFVRFGLVGTTGILVNLAFVWLGDRVIFAALQGWTRNACVYLLGIVTSILSNFLLNDAWTWRDRRGGSGGFATRLARYYGVAALAAGVQFATSLAVTAALARTLLGSPHAVLATGWKSVAVLCGVALGMGVNFVVNHRWTYGGRS